MDIRNFFPVKNGNSVINKSQEKIKKQKKVSAPSGTINKVNTRKRPLLLLDSDSDESPLPVPIPSKRKNLIDDDDCLELLDVKKTKKTEAKIGLRKSPRKNSPSTSKKTKSSNLIEKKESNATKILASPKRRTSPRKSHKPDIIVEKKNESFILPSKFFGKTPIDRSSKLIVEKTKIKPINDASGFLDDEFLIEDDEDFEKTLAQLDIPSSTESTHSSQEVSSKVNGSETTKISSSKFNSKKQENIPQTEDKIENHKKSETPSKNKEQNGKVVEKELSISIQSPNLDSGSSKTPDSSKKKENFLNYQRYLQRDGPTALGSKEIPEGAKGCLERKTFILTGVLDSLERDDAKELINKYGGKVMSTLTKSTTYIIVGRDAGPAKLEKAEKFGTKQLNEDGLLDLIRKSSPGKSAKDKALNQKLEKTPTSKPSTSADENEIHKRKKLKLEYSAQEINPGKNTELIKNVSKSESKKIHSSPTKIEDGDGLMWVDKHKPQMLKQVIGQQGDKSNAKKLVLWLKNWHKNLSLPKKPASRWGGADDGASYKAALLSGSPGIGKTTTAQLACKELEFSFIELNASDTRSKRSLHEELSQTLQSRTITGVSSDGKISNSNKHVIIMDEVDGMSGNEDRGGTQELIALIKSTKIPIICICNDRAHPKIRSLSNYCFDLRFQKPRLEQIKASVLSICCKEGIKIPSDILNEIIIGSCQDIRQVLHNVFLWSAKASISGTEDTKKKYGQTKDIKLGPFEVLKKVFASVEEKTNIHEKSSLFFHDYSLSPLFVQENYIHVNPKNAKGNKLEHLNLLSKAADSIADGDLVDKIIRSTNNWSLLPTQAIFSSVIPGDTMRGHLNQMINFPSWLGKNSNKNHMDRVLQQLQMHMRLRTSGNKSELNTQYIPLLHHKITSPLVEKESEGVKEVIDTMEHYFLLREDIESISELALWSGKTDPMSKVQPKVKANLTRTFNKEGFLIPYSMNVVKKSKKQSASGMEEGEEESVSETEVSDDDLNADAMVKQKKSKVDTKAVDDKPSTSKGKGRGKSSLRGKKK